VGIIWVGKNLFPVNTLYIPICKICAFGLSTLKAGLQPGLLEMDAWNTEKLIRAYAARKKFESRGAIAFSWAAKDNIFYTFNDIHLYSNMLRCMYEILL